MSGFADFQGRFQPYSPAEPLPPEPHRHRPVRPAPGLDEPPPGRSWRAADPAAEVRRMVIGIGIDLVAVDRIARVLRRRGERFLARVYTAGELAACPPGEQYARRLAARFAAKEAALKALGTGLAGGIRWREIEVRRAAGGRPEIVLHGRAAEYAAGLGVSRMHLSLSHDGPFAAAVVVAERDMH